MAGPYPTASHVAEIVHGAFKDRTLPRAAGLGKIPMPLLRIGPLMKDTMITGLSIRFFDMETDDGRVYRVRVSDITPEREESVT